jgi:hypothetical protein
MNNRTGKSKMMKKFFTLSAVLLVVSGFLLSSTQFEMVKDFQMEGDSYEGSLFSWGGNISIKGIFDGTVIMIGGTLELDGQVAEDVICVASEIIIGPDTYVKGDFLVIGGHLEHQPELTLKKLVNGEYIYVDLEDLKKIETTLLPALSDSRNIAFIRAVKVILWFIISLIVFAVLPKKIMAAEEMFAGKVVRFGVTGVLSFITFVFLLVIFIVLCFFIVGIPLLFLLIMFYFAAQVFGRTVMFYYIGIRLANWLRLKRILPAIFILIGALVYAGLKFLPVVGPFLLIAENIFEIGIGVGYFFRKRLKMQS